MYNKNDYLIKIHNLMVDLRDSTEEKDEDKVSQFVEQIKDILDEYEEADFNEEDDFE